jgi:crossover junction endodeoxyribonuclease RusA
MTAFSFVVPGDPRPKQRPRHGNGHTYTAAETVHAENVVKNHARRARAPKLLGPVVLELKFFRATRRRCDLDNLAKLVQDALNGIAYRDDDQIVSLVASKAHDAANPRTEVTVSLAGFVGGGPDQAIEDAEDAEIERTRRVKGLEPA